MKPTADIGRPDWVSNELFPYESRFFETSTGKRLHYIDEGSGKPVVFVHGNPSWSFEFRHLIEGLKDDHRCIAMDHIGFGLSDRETDCAKLHPRCHAENFAALMDRLDLRDITLYISDWGGPIGLDYARRNPDRIARIVVANSWCWPVASDFHFTAFSFMMSSWPGQYMIKTHNIFVEQVMPMAVGDKSVLSGEVMDHYRNAQPRGGRHGSAALPGYIVSAATWLREIWGDRAAFAEKPTYLFWGLKDIAFREKELRVWIDALPNHRVERFDDCGHFLAEEAPERMIGSMRRFIQGDPSIAAA